MIGDWSPQRFALGDAWHGADLHAEISETVMLRSAVDGKRCVLRDPKRCDERLAAWLSIPLRPDVLVTDADVRDVLEWQSKISKTFKTPQLNELLVAKGEVPKGLKADSWEFKR